MASPVASERNVPLLLGIDTGGTFTDAVVMDGDATSVIAKAKVPTTHHDLVQGVTAAIDSVLGEGSGGAFDPASIGLVSVSTTLATNALVEGHGEPACLVLAGFGKTELERLQTSLSEAGLRTADLDSGNTDSKKAADALLVPVAGGHDALGDELAGIDEAVIATVAADTKDRVTAYAVATQFSVRNPSHEQAIAAVLTSTTGHPVTRSHELSARLDGPRRAITALLNARLIGMVARLQHAVRAALDGAAITAPLMMVRGDGSLVSAELLARRPIETILSGPAASVVGAQFLATDGHTAGPHGSPAKPGRAIVVDIGGTTTDIASIVDGRPEITADGASVAGYHTMVEAIDITTSGLGGDSEVRVDTGDTAFGLGPTRAIPLSCLAGSHPDIVDALARELASPTSRGQGRLTLSAEGVPVGEEPTNVGPDARISTFTPTDAAVVLGWVEAKPIEREAATLGAELLARRSDPRGKKLADSAAAFAELVTDHLIARSAALVVAAARRADQLDANPSLPPSDEILAAGLRHHRGFLSIDVAVDAVLVAVGAAASAYYPEVADRIGARLVAPQHGDVANAVGAAVGPVRVEAQLTITRPRAGRYEVHGAISTIDPGCVYRTLDDAKVAALEALTAEVVEMAVAAGAKPDTLEVVDRWRATTAMVAGRELLVDATLTVVATGRPKLG